MRLPDVERLRATLDAGDLALGTFLNLGSPIAAEVAGVAGFDWVVLDLEHGSGSEAALVGQLQALEGHAVVAVVRVESIERPRFSFALDRGAAGIMVPRTEDAATAERALSYMRYPPSGVRGVATLNRACGFGLYTDEVIPAFNDTVLGVMQIESEAAVQNAAAIAEVDGVDILFVGPMDLTHGMGIPGDIEHPRFRAALAHVLGAARRSGKHAGILASSAAVAERYHDEGFTFIAVGSDSSLMLGAMTQVAAARQARGAIPRVSGRAGGAEQVR